MIKLKGEKRKSKFVKATQRPGPREESWPAGEKPGEGGIKPPTGKSAKNRPKVGHYKTEAGASRLGPALAGSALDEVAKKLFDLGFFASIVFLGNRAGLVAKLEAENLVLERIHADADVLVNGGRGLR